MPAGPGKVQPGQRRRQRWSGSAALSWLVVATIALSATLGAFGSSPASAQPPIPDPEAQFPNSTEDGADPGIDIEFYKFPDGVPFEYGGTHFGVWSANCELLTELENETDEWVTWQSFLEADFNYDCGDNYRSTGADANGATTGIGGYGRNGFPADVYECGVDAGAWNHADRKIFAALCSSIFGINKMTVSWSIAVIEWAFRFEIGTAMAPYTSVVGGKYFDAVGGGAADSLYWSALAFTTFYAGVKALRGQMSRGAGELGLSVLLLMAFWALVIYGAGFGGVTNWTLGASTSVSAEIGNLTLDDSATGNCPRPVDPTNLPPWAQTIVANYNDKYGGTGQLVCPMANGVFIALVERPYDLINWGSSLDNTPCEGPRNAILASGPWGNHDFPRHTMADSGCTAQADFNHDPSDARVGIAFASLIVTFLTLVLIISMALVLLSAQIVLVLMVMIMPFAMISAALPGTGRNLFFKWLTAIIKVGVLVVMMTALLALHLSTLNVGMKATENSPWAVQAGVMILVTVLMFSLMRKAVTASGSAAARATSAIAQAATPTGTTGTAGLATAGQFGQRAADAGASAGSTAAKVGVGAVLIGAAAAVGAGPTMKGFAKQAAMHNVAGRAHAASARRRFDAQPAAVGPTR